MPGVHAQNQVAAIGERKGLFGSEIERPRRRHQLRPAAAVDAEHRAVGWRHEGGGADLGRHATLVDKGLVLGVDVLDVGAEQGVGREQKLALRLAAPNAGLSGVLVREIGDQRWPELGEQQGGDLLPGVFQVERLEVQLDTVVEEPVLEASGVGGDRFRIIGAPGARYRVEVEAPRLEAGRDVRVEQ